MTQNERIIDYLERYGSITPFEAFADLGITKLATRISEMTRDGIEFEREKVTGVNRFGDRCHFMRYKLKEQ